jgi:sugar phosphate isomerase/epimerase
MESGATFTISAFGDEIADDLQDQLAVLKELRVGYLDLRGVGGKNVLHLDDDEAAVVRQTCDDHGMAVSCIGSPIGKSPISDPIEHEAANLERIFQIAETVGTRRVRIFSFYPPDTSSNAHYDQYVDEAAARLTRLADIAQRDGYTLLLENEKGIVGDTIDRCHAIMDGIDNSHLRFLWDPANFVQVNESAPTEQGWASLGAYTAYVHIKDAVLAGGGIRPAGEGDGQVGELLTKLIETGYQGFLALEPHLAIAGHSSGFSGAEGMARAVDALRQLMAERGCEEKAAGV